MPAKNQDLHGNVPDDASVALVLIDMINDLAFEGGDQLLEAVLPMAERLAKLKRRCKAAGIPVIYCNDNWGRWQSDLDSLFTHVLESDAPGRPVVEQLRPDDDDYFVLKPKQSGFFATPLDTLLKYLKVKTLILTGVTGNICVMFTANDAYMRDLHLVVPSDCVASIEADANKQALKHMRTVLKADTTPSTELDLERLRQQDIDE